MFDPLTAKVTARAALKFINEKLGKRPVVAVVYSHSHADHFAGVRGVVDEADFGISDFVYQQIHSEIIQSIIEMVQFVKINLLFIVYLWHLINK